MTSRFQKGTNEMMKRNSAESDLSTSIARAHDLAKQIGYDMPIDEYLVRCEAVRNELEASLDIAESMVQMVAIISELEKKAEIVPGPGSNIVLFPVRRA